MAVVAASRRVQHGPVGVTLSRLHRVAPPERAVDFVPVEPAAQDVVQRRHRRLRIAPEKIDQVELELAVDRARVAQHFVQPGERDIHRAGSHAIERVDRVIDDAADFFVFARRPEERGQHADLHVGEAAVAHEAQVGGRGVAPARLGHRVRGIESDRRVEHHREVGDAPCERTGHVLRVRTEG